MLWSFFLEFWRHPKLWAMLSIPPVTAFVTWLHVGMALWMLFYPISFVGIRIPRLPWGLKGLGWQGIVPAKADKISGIIVDQTLTRLGSLDEFIGAMNPDEIARIISLEVTRHIDSIIDGIMNDQAPLLWANTPFAVKRRVYAKARKAAPSMVFDLVRDLTLSVEDMVDMRQMITRQMSKNPRLMVNMFLKVGKKEINFIWRVSALIGMGFGLLQMGLFYLVPAHWTVPFFAALWGILTNWIAIFMVFHPVYPVPVRFIRLYIKQQGFVWPHWHTYHLQGGFMKRQDEVAQVFAQVVVRDLVTLERIMMELLYGDKKHLAKARVWAHTLPVLESTGLMAMLDAMDEARQNAVKHSIINHSIKATMTPISEPKFNVSRADKIFGLFVARIRALTPAEFQNLLRPAFKEDELTLIILGGITGGLLGLMHLVLVFF